jgi:hypothetical protein
MPTCGVLVWKPQHSGIVTTRDALVVFVFAVSSTGCAPLNQETPLQVAQRPSLVPAEHSADSQITPPSIDGMSFQELVNYYKNQPRQPAKKYGGPVLMGGRLDGVYVAP